VTRPFSWPSGDPRRHPFQPATGPFATVIAVLAKKQRRLALIWFLVASVFGIAFLLLFPWLIFTY